MGESDVKTVSDQLVDFLVQSGVDAAFGLPGGPVAPFFNALERSPDIRLVMTQHEGAASHMAMGYARGSGKLGFCFATSGPGFSNLLTGVYSAFEENIPLFVLTGNVSSALKGKRAAQDSFETGVSAEETLNNFTVLSETLHHPDELADKISRLVNTAIQERKPVHLNLPVDLSRAPAAQGFQLQLAAEQVTPLEEKDLQSCLDFLACERPLVFLGNGIKASRLEARMSEVLEQLQVPVLVTTHGKGALAVEHPCFRGEFGFAANSLGKDFLESYQPDGILFLGTQLGELASLGWSKLLAQPGVRIHVDRNPKVLNSIYEMTHTVASSIENYLDALVSTERKGVRAPLESVGSPNDEEGDYKRSETAIHPRSLMRKLDASLMADDVLVSDIGNSMAWIIHHLPARKGRQFFIPIGLGAMGSGIASSRSDRKILQFWDRSDLQLPGITS